MEDGRDDDEKLLVARGYQRSKAIYGGV